MFHDELKLLTDAWQECVINELEQSKNRLHWVMALSEPFCTWMKELRFRKIHMTFELEEIIHYHLFTDHETKGYSTFSVFKDPKRGYFYQSKNELTREENNFLSCLFKQLELTTILQEIEE